MSMDKQTNQEAMKVVAFVVDKIAEVEDPQAQLSFCMSVIGSLLATITSNASPSFRGAVWDSVAQAMTLGSNVKSSEARKIYEDD